MQRETVTEIDNEEKDVIVTIKSTLEEFFYGC